MDRREPSQEMRGTLAPCVAALGLILLAFWVSDVTPGQPVPEEQPWVAPLRAVDEALARQNVSAAERLWHDAYGHAVASRRWDGMVAVGDASLRIGQIAGRRAAAETRARQAYLAALFRARQQQAVEGALRTAQAFADLGDREVAEQCLRVARDLTAHSGDAEADARVRALAGRLAAR
jgi:hypothetical protein